MIATSKPTGFDAERATLETAVLGALKGDGDALPFQVFAEGRPLTGLVAGKAWARMTVRPGSVGPAEIGPEMRRNAGVVILQIFLPKDTGTILALQTSDRLDALCFTSVDLPGGVGTIDFGCVSSVAVGTDAATGFLQINASLPYVRDVFVVAPVPVLPCPDTALVTELGDWLVTEDASPLVYA